MDIDHTKQEWIPPAPREKIGPQVIAPNNPPWGVPIALLLWAVSVLLIIFVPLFFVMPYVFSLGRTHFKDIDLKEFVLSDPTAVLLSILAIVPVHILTFVLAWLVVTKGRRFPFWKTLGNEWGKYRWWHLVIIVVVFYALTIVVTSILPEQDNDLLKMLRSSKQAVYLIAFLATFTAPVVEEVVYRGVLFSALVRATGTAWTVGIVTVLFAGVHFFQYWGSPGTLVLVTGLSLILTVLRASSGNLLPCIILHTIFNGLQSLALVLEPFFQTSTDPTVSPTGFLIHLLK